MVMYRDQLVQHTQIAASEALSYININSRLCSILLDPTSHLLGLLCPGHIWLCTARSGRSAWGCCGLSERPEVRCAREMLCGTHEQEPSQGAMAGVLRGPLKCLVMLQVSNFYTSLVHCTFNDQQVCAFAGRRPTQLYALVTPSMGPDHTNDSGHLTHHVPPSWPYR